MTDATRPWWLVMVVGVPCFVACNAILGNDSVSLWDAGGGDGSGASSSSGTEEAGSASGSSSGSASGATSGGSGSSGGTSSSSTGSASDSGGGASSSGSASDSGGGASSSGSASDSGGGASSSGSASDSGGGASSSGSASDSGGSSSGGDAGGSSGGDGGLPYPAGPYCAAAGTSGAMATGCVIPNLTWTGYVDNTADALATSKPYVSYSLLDLYNEAHATGQKYAMINLAELDDPGSQNSATAIGATNDAGVTAGASVDQAGGILIEVLMTAGFTAPPTKANLDTWIASHNLHVTTVADLDASLPTNNTLGRRDQAYIIDLTTMAVLQYIDGSIVSSGSNNSGPLGMAAMHTLLGK